MLRRTVVVQHSLILKVLRRTAASQQSKHQRQLLLRTAAVQHWKHRQLQRVAALPFEPMALSQFSDLKAAVADIQQQQNQQSRTPPTSKEATGMHDWDTTLPRLQRNANAAMTIARAATQASTAAATRRRSLHRAQFLPPYFVSPKHDGVRCISFGAALAAGVSVTPSASASFAGALPKNWASMLVWQRMQYTRKRLQIVQGGRGRQPPQQLYTCFTRFGRPIVGLRWIEAELQQLRDVCGDANLVLDGELYLHRSDIQRGKLSVEGQLARTHATAAVDTANFIYGEVKPGGAAKAAEDVRGLAAQAASLNAGHAARQALLRQQTGFQQVSAVVTSLRGGLGDRRDEQASSASSTSILDLIATLPRMCVFDVVSYTPPPAPTGPLMRRAMALHNVTHLSSLTVTPNRTPFIQRLRTLVFLFTLLSMQHQHLHSKQQPQQVATPTAIAAPPVPSSADRRRHPTSDAAKDGYGFFYRGGRYVQVVPYAAVNGLEEVTQQWLPRYLKARYEGAVVRTALNVYSATWKRRSSRAGTSAGVFSKHKRRSAVGHRSPTAAKLLPVSDSEFVVTRVLFKSKPQAASASKAKTRSSPPVSSGRSARAPYGLQCMTDRGVAFRVTLDTMAAEHRQTFLAAVAKRETKRSGMVGLFVTLHYPSLTSRGVPRFPKIKGLRGGKGWFL